MAARTSLGRRATEPRSGARSFARSDETLASFSRRAGCALVSLRCGLDGSASCRQRSEATDPVQCPWPQAVEAEPVGPSRDAYLRTEGCLVDVVDQEPAVWTEGAYSCGQDTDAFWRQAIVEEHQVGRR